MSEETGSNTNIEVIYIRLLDEGTEVFRPTTGEALGGSVFKISATDDYDPRDETWEFPPGTIVKCRKRVIDNEEFLIACETASSVDC